jgi:hypothetical protein
MAFEDSTFDENPAVDNSEFAAEWESLWEDVPGDPYTGVGDLAMFIEQVLDANKIDIDDPVGGAGLEAELVAEVQNLRDVARRTRVGGDVPPADLAGAIESARLLWESFQPTIARTPARGYDPIAVEQIELESDAGDIGETRERVEEPPYDARYELPPDVAEIAEELDPDALAAEVESDDEADADAK